MSLSWVIGELRKLRRFGVIVTDESRGLQSFNVKSEWGEIPRPAGPVGHLRARRGELTHSLHARHDNAFWTALGQCMPDYKTRKDWLASNGSQFL